MIRTRPNISKRGHVFKNGREYFKKGSFYCKKVVFDINNVSNAAHCPKKSLIPSADATWGWTKNIAQKVNFYSINMNQTHNPPP